MQTLDVVNGCLASMGESPLNSLSDPHSFRGAAIATLERKSREIQARGWWFNTEHLEISPSPVDSRLYLPGDVIELQSANGRYVQRGRLVYDTLEGTTQFNSPLQVSIVRLVPFPDVPEIVAQYIYAATVVRFQAEYDGDSEKGRLLQRDEVMAMAKANSADTRNSAANLLANNSRIMRIKARHYRLLGGYSPLGNRRR